MTSTVPEPESSQVLDPSDSPIHHTGTPPPPVPPLLDIPFVGTPLVGCPFAGVIINPAQKKWDFSSSSTFGDHCYKQTHVTPKRSKLGVNSALHRAMRTCPHWHQRLGPAPNHKGRDLPVPLPVQPRPLLNLMMM